MSYRRPPTRCGNAEMSSWADRTGANGPLRLLRIRGLLSSPKAAVAWRLSEGGCRSHAVSADVEQDLA
jgi:hypothetical protein